MDKINIRYRVLSVNEEEQSMLVRYSTDFLSEQDLTTGEGNAEDNTPLRCITDYNLSIWDGIETEEALDKFITSAAPIAVFKLKHKIMDSNVDHTINGRLSMVKSLLNKTVEKEISLLPLVGKEQEIEVLLIEMV